MAALAHQFSPAAYPLDGFEDVRSLLTHAAETGVFPGAVLVVARGGEVVAEMVAGQRALKGRSMNDLAPMFRGMVFDVAGLTGSLVTTTILMRLVDEGRVRLGDRVGRYLEGFGVLGKSGVTVEHLLSHTSGLPHWHPFYEELLREHGGARVGILTSRGARDFVVNRIQRMPLSYESGTRCVYSDLGLIILGQIIETVTGLPLDKAAQRFVFGPLGLRSSSFIDLLMLRCRGLEAVSECIAPTEECAWRGRILCGEVHDDNAWAMGGIAGHSGLFSTAGDVHVLSSELLRAWHGRSSFVSSEVVRQFWATRPELGESRWRLGWDAPSAENGMHNAGLSASSIGMCGVTGCSLWIDPESATHVVLLSNRVHPHRANKRIVPFRAELHRAIGAALRG